MSASAEPAVGITPDDTLPAHGVSLAEATRVWLCVALLSFGGPAGQIAVMHRIVVQERRWISEARFLHALNYCHLLPGPDPTPSSPSSRCFSARSLSSASAGLTRCWLMSRKRRL